MIELLAIIWSNFYCYTPKKGWLGHAGYKVMLSCVLKKCFNFCNNCPNKEPFLSLKKAKLYLTRAQLGSHMVIWVH